MNETDVFHICYLYFSHFRKVSAPEFQRLTTKYPGLMNEIHIMAKQAQQDAKDYGQA